MYVKTIKEIAADILFLDDPESISEYKSFDSIGFTSIDFIDFCFEIKSKINAGAEPDYLWPFSKMQSDPEICVDGNWTEKGRKLVQMILQVSNEEVVPPGKIGTFWTPAFCSRRLEALANE